MKSNGKSIVQVIITGVLAVVCCIGLLLVSSLIPQEVIYKNAKNSVFYFENKPLFEMMVSRQDAVERDNYADCISTGIAYHLGNDMEIEGSDRSNPFVRILEARYTQDEEENVNDGFHRAVRKNAPGNKLYSRYWHGGAAVIRLLLPFLDVSGMHVLFFVIGIILNLGWIAFLVVRKDYVLAISYLFGIIFGKILFGYTCFEYSFVCLLMPLFSFLIYIAVKVNAKREKALISPEAVFLLAGILTCFFDFLTAETLTFTVPAFVALVCLEKEKKKKPFTISPVSETNRRKNETLFFLLRIGAAWLIGYALMFGLKWGITALVLGPEEASTALASVAERTVGAVHETKNLASPTVGFIKRIESVYLYNFSCLYGIPSGTPHSATMLILLGTPAFLYILWFFFRNKEMLHGDGKSGESGNANKKGKKGFPFFPLYLLIAAVPLLRFAILSNHSYMHYFFTYRALMAVVMIMVYCSVKTTILSNLLEQ